MCPGFGRDRANTSESRAGIRIRRTPSSPPRTGRRCTRAQEPAPAGVHGLQRATLTVWNFARSSTVAVASCTARCSSLPAHPRGRCNARQREARSSVCADTGSPRPPRRRICAPQHSRLRASPASPPHVTAGGGCRLRSMRGCTCMSSPTRSLRAATASRIGRGRSPPWDAHRSWSPSTTLSTTSPRASTAKPRPSSGSRPAVSRDSRPPISGGCGGGQHPLGSSANRSPDCTIPVWRRSSR